YPRTHRQRRREPGRCGCRRLRSAGADGAPWDNACARLRSQRPWAARYWVLYATRTIEGDHDAEPDRGRAGGDHDPPGRYLHGDQRGWANRARARAGTVLPRYPSHLLVPAAARWSALDAGNGGSA